jgi:hypothetical protein
MNYISLIYELIMNFLINLTLKNKNNFVIHFENFRFKLLIF